MLWHQNFYSNMSTEPNTIQKFASLKYFNLFILLSQAIQGFFILYLSNSFTFPITTTYLSRNVFLNIITPTTVEIFRLPLGISIATVLFVSSFTHLILILPRIHGWYLNNLKKGINYMRWIEYSISSAGMVVLIGLLSGIFDLSSLIMLFFLDAAMILFGLVSERAASKDMKTAWASFAFGSLIGAIPWLVIALHFFGAWNNHPSLIPSFVYRTAATIFIFFFSFALNAVLWLLKVGPWKDYVFVEKVYIFLSLTSKSALAWQIFSGALF
jgi:hypothetical protein